jgi:hypothetical protein
VKDDGRMVGGDDWQGKAYNREEWKKLLRTARNRQQGLKNFWCRVIIDP